MILVNAWHVNYNVIVITIKGKFQWKVILVVNFVITHLMERCVRVFIYVVTCPCSVHCHIDNHLNKSISYVKSNLDFFYTVYPLDIWQLKMNLIIIFSINLILIIKFFLSSKFQQLKICDHKMFDYQYPLVCDNQNKFQSFDQQCMNFYPWLSDWIWVFFCCHPNFCF